MAATPCALSHGKLEPEPAACPSPNVLWQGHSGGLARLASDTLYLNGSYLGTIQRAVANRSGKGALKHFQVASLCVELNAHQMNRQP